MSDDYTDPDFSSSFLYLGVPYFWLRETLLARKASDWPVSVARVEHTHRTRGGYGNTIRVYLHYSYSVDGQDYSGCLVRESAWPMGIKKVLARYPVGTTVDVHFRPDRPSESYLPSGMGSVEALILLTIFGILPIMVVLFIGLMAALRNL